MFESEDDTDKVLVMVSFLIILLNFGVILKHAHTFDFSYKCQAAGKNVLLNKSF